MESLYAPSHLDPRGKIDFAKISFKRPAVPSTSVLVGYIKFNLFQTYTQSHMINCLNWTLSMISDLVACFAFDEALYFQQNILLMKFQII